MPSHEQPLSVPGALWSIDPRAWARIEQTLAHSPLEALRPPDGWRPASPLSIVEGVAVVDIAGPLVKGLSAFHYAFDSSATELVTDAVRAAAGSAQAKAILLRVDSPGGSVDGLAELVDAVWEARRQKTVWAQVAGLAASAAYWVASQAQRIFAGRLDEVGSIGVRMLTYDFSRFFANMGVEAVAIDTGPYKSAGAFGTAITAAQRADWQKTVDAIGAEFLAGIRRGRSVPALEEAADGRIFLAAEALSKGLIDGIQTFETTLAALQRQPAAGPTRTRSTIAMSETQTTLLAAEPQAPAQPQPQPAAAAPPQPRGASYEDLKQGCAGAPPEFLCQQLERRATLDQARAAWMQQQQEAIAAGQKRIAELEARANMPGAAPVGSRPGGTEGEGGTAKERLDAAVAELVAAGRPRHLAAQMVLRRDPALREALVAEGNAGRKFRG
ncbi:MAG: S49 family peptidase [Elusimicrobia bacterium]|nr:S49 family peptidase [Elusimicrobiota bacterium]